MSNHLRIEIEKLKKYILALSTIVEESVQKSVQSIQERDEKLAEYVIDKDTEIDAREVELEEECLKVLALHQPVASDLRFIISVLKINNDIERIGDLAVNIAERGLHVSTHEPVNIPFDLIGMADITRIMLRDSLQSLINTDVVLAANVVKLDEKVDAINRDMYNRVTAAIRNDLSQLETLLHYLSVSRYLERIADHATNIAEDVLYMLEGEIVRHRIETVR
ncbi:MAG TPA: phosphate signaling complex protein PhoU [Armatimonadota bacterium]|nr:phosphate signaling complex protein PhoU [Armatimonadota bacterium]